MSYFYKGLTISNIIKGGSTSNTSYTGFPNYTSKANNFDNMNTVLGFMIDGVDIINNAAATSTTYESTINSPSIGNLSYSTGINYNLTIDPIFNHMTAVLVGGGGGGCSGQGDGGPSPATTPGASGSGGGGGAVAYMERIPLATNGYSYEINVGVGGRGRGGEYKGGFIPAVSTSTSGGVTRIRSNNDSNYFILAGGGGNANTFRTAAAGGTVNKGPNAPPITYSASGNSSNVNNASSGYGTSGGYCNGFPKVGNKDVTIINLTSGSSFLTGGPLGINNTSGNPGGNSAKVNDNVNNLVAPIGEYRYGGGSFGGGGGGGGGGNGGRRGGAGAPGNPGICIIYLYV